MDIILGTLQDAFFAAIASVGFASISNPPHRIYPVCAGIAAVGHSLRYVLMNAADMHLVIASLCAATVIGLLAVFLAPKTKAPAEAVSFPALLPMIPGMYAYRTFQNLILCLRGGEEEFHHYFYLCGSNGLTCLTVLLLRIERAYLSDCPSGHGYRSDYPDIHFQEDFFQGNATDLTIWN